MTSVAEQTIHTMEITRDESIDAPIDLVWQALLDEMGPEGQMPGGKSLQLKVEPFPGGRWFRDLGNNTGHLWGHVQVIKPPKLLELCGPMAMSYPAFNHIQYRLSESGGLTQLTLVHKAIGMIPQEHRDGMPEGWDQWMKEIRALAERRARGGRKDNKR